MKIVGLRRFLTRSAGNEAPDGAGAAAVQRQTRSEIEARKKQLQNEIELLRDHFDTEFYLDRNDDVRDSGIDPLAHFCEFGWREHRDPSPDFSTLYYLNSNPELAEQGTNPLLHYVTIGKENGRLGKLPDSGELARNDLRQRIENEIASVEPYFDAVFYLGNYGDIAELGQDPLEHYMRFGWREGRDPSPYFSTSFYLKTNPDIEAASINPFWHYVVAGRDEGRPGLPAIGQRPDVQPSDSAALSEAAASPEAEVIRPHFDVDFYFEQRPGLRNSGIDPVLHYLYDGWLEYLDPHPDFSTSGYLHGYPDVADAAINPYLHYIIKGRAEGRLPMGLGDQDANASDDDDKASGGLSDIETIRSHFDIGFYLSRNQDLVAAGVDPVEHYWTQGWKEGRDPSPTFSTSYYLEANPDVADLGINPFWHYVVAGKQEGRPARHPGGYRVEQLRNTLPLEQAVKRWKSNRLPDSLLNAKDLTRLISPGNGVDRQTLILSIGHDNYHAVSGGVQLCEYREEVIAVATGALYVNLHPWQPLPRLAKEDEDSDPVMLLLIDGTEIGACRMTDLVRVVSKARTEFADVQVVIHQMLGHLPERLANLVRATGRSECWLWLHDFFTICPSFTLQRNGVTYCGAPPIGSNSCAVCLYGEERIEHAGRMKTFFEEVQVKVLAPSQVAADIWRKRSALSPASLQVQPHMELTWRKRTSPAPKETEEITIAFLGTPAPHKGWPVFESLFRNLSKGDGYRFLFLGSTNPTTGDMDHAKVHVTAEDPDAMIDAVRLHGVDLVVHWVSWPETFSLSTYEALAGGAYLVTNRISGNVAATVKRLKRGAILDDEDDLTRFFMDGRADNMVARLRAERRKSEVDHRLSRMVHDAIDAESALTGGAQ